MPKSSRALRAPRVLIQVSDEDISLAERDSSAHCMIADAIKRNIPEAKHILVDLQSIRWTDTAKSRRFTYLTPRVAQVALIAFDQGVHDRPFNFVLSGGQSNAVNIGKKNGGPYERKALINRGARKPPLVRGGRTPPVAILSNHPRFGMQRGFGLRHAGKVTAEDADAAGFPA